MPTTEREALAAEAVLDLAVRPVDFDVLGLLHDLLAHAIALLAVRSASITVVDAAGQVDYLAASDEISRQLAEDQIDLDEGPCVDSTRTGTALPPMTLGPSGPGRRRWPRFTPRAVRAGITGVAAVPLGNPPMPVLGALNLMTARPPLPGAEDLRLAQALANCAAASIRSRYVLLAKDELITQLQDALDSRIVIEQAKGVLSSRLGVPVEDAFTILRRYARAHRQKLTDLAELIAQGTVPAELDTTS